VAGITLGRVVTGVTLRLVGGRCYLGDGGNRFYFANGRWQVLPWGGSVAGITLGRAGGSTLGEARWQVLPGA
jgi:hypothetical protein